MLAKEQGLDVNEVLETVRSIEGYLYRGKPLTPKSRETAIQIVKKIAHK